MRCFDQQSATNLRFGKPAAQNRFKCSAHSRATSFMICCICMVNKRCRFQSCSTCAAKWCSDCHVRITMSFLCWMRNVENWCCTPQSDCFAPKCPVCRSSVTDHESIDEPILLGELNGFQHLSYELTDEMMRYTEEMMRYTDEMMLHTDEMMRHAQSRGDGSTKTIMHTTIIPPKTSLPVRQTHLTTDSLKRTQIFATNETAMRILIDWDRWTAPIDCNTFLKERSRFLQTSFELLDLIEHVIATFQRRVVVQHYIRVLCRSQRLRNGLERLVLKHSTCPNRGEDSDDDLCVLLSSFSSRCTRVA